MNIPVETSIIWGGDFNFIVDLHLESSGGNPRLKVKSIEQLYSILNEFDLCDLKDQLYSERLYYIVYMGKFL